MTAGLLIAVDFDGTVAAIATDPRAVAIDGQFASFFRRASEIDGIAVAIVSGRDVDDLSARIRDMPVYLAGSHGLEILSPDRRWLRRAEALVVDLAPEITATAARLGARIERKKHAVALHWRDTPAVNGSHPLVQSFRAWAASNGLDVIEGRRVVEARSRGGGKEDALRHLAQITGASRVVYAGDDLTDFAALRFAAARGRAFFVASDEREAPTIATTVRSRDELLRHLIEELNRAAA